MQRIARQTADIDKTAQALSGYGEVTRILQQHLPSSAATLFARPKTVGEDIVEWYSELGGQPQPIAQLDEKSALALRHLLNERLASIEQLAGRLEAQGGDGIRQAELLRQAADYPTDGNLYSLNGQPLITCWGGGENPIKPIPPVVAPGAAAAAAGATAAGGRRWWLWLLLALLLLLLLAALFWWLWCREDEQPVVPPEEPPVVEQPIAPEPVEPAPEVVEPEPEPIPEPVPEPEPEPEPIPEPEPDPVDLMAQRINSQAKDCAALFKMQQSEPMLKQHASLRKLVDQHLNRNCKRQLITNAKNLCPDQRPKELAPEIAIVFDASGSMDISMLATPKEIEQAMAAQGLANLILGNRAPDLQKRVFREPKRITVARDATLEVARKLPSDANAGLVLVETCDSARTIGMFPPSRRNQLIAHLQSVIPQGGTPLADGIAKAGALLDGVNRESVMLVVSDGEESCGLDPCSIARDLAKRKPYLKINVVDILGTGAGNCLASATGGKVFTANNVSDLQLMTTQAASDVLAPAHCR